MIHTVLCNDSEVQGNTRSPGAPARTFAEPAVSHTSSEFAIIHSIVDHLGTHLRVSANTCSSFRNSPTLAGKPGEVGNVRPDRTYKLIPRGHQDHC